MYSNIRKKHPNPEIQAFTLIAQKLVGTRILAGIVKVATHSNSGDVYYNTYKYSNIPP